MTTSLGDRVSRRAGSPVQIRVARPKKLGRYPIDEGLSVRTVPRFLFAPDLNRASADHWEEERAGRARKRARRPVARSQEGDERRANPGCPTKKLPEHTETTSINISLAILGSLLCLLVCNHFNLSPLLSWFVRRQQFCLILYPNTNAVLLLEWADKNFNISYS